MYVACVEFTDYKLSLQYTRRGGNQWTTEVVHRVASTEKMYVVRNSGSKMMPSWHCKKMVVHKAIRNF